MWDMLMESTFSRLQENVRQKGKKHNQMDFKGVKDYQGEIPVQGAKYNCLSLKYKLPPRKKQEF